jgi:uncharacterized protein (DUF427 family)
MANEIWQGGTGATASDWSLGSNWSSGNVPQPGDEVTIPSDTPTADLEGETATIGSLTINSGATVDLSGGSLTTGTLAGAGQIIDSAASAAALTVDDGGTFSGTVSGAITLTVAGPTGTVLTLTSQSNSYAGGTVLQSGTFETAPGEAGTGAITFTNGSPAPATLEITGHVWVNGYYLLANPIENFANGDTIDLADIATNPESIVGGDPGSVYIYAYGLSGYLGELNLWTLYDPGRLFKVVPDGDGGSIITVLLGADTSDFNGDGRSDVLWQYEDATNPSDPDNGETALWLMNGTTPTSEALIATPGPDWDVITTAYFGNDEAGILWQYDDASNAADPYNGEAAIWLMNGTTPIDETMIATPPASWHAITTGDFTGNAQSDIVWQYEDASNPSDPDNGYTAVWMMNGTTPTSETIIATPPASWHVITTSDFIGNGNDDIVWQYENASNPADPNNGEMAIWVMNGAQPTDEVIVTNQGPSWHIITASAVSDLGEVLVQYENAWNAADPNNGETAIWQVSGQDMQGLAADTIIAYPGPNWHAMGLGDYQGNGASDILWQYENASNPADPSNGETAIWTMNYTEPVAETIFATPPASWHPING